MKFSLNLCVCECVYRIRRNFKSIGTFDLGGIAVVGAAAVARGEPAGDETAVVQSMPARARVSPTGLRVGSVATTVAVDCVTVRLAVVVRGVGCLWVPCRCERKERDW